MKPSTVERLRACVLVVSLAATLIDAAVIVAIGVFGVPERVFASMSFRIGVLIVVALALVATRRAAGSAFRAALAGRHVLARDPASSVMSVSADCPLRPLVMFHLRFNHERRAPASPRGGVARGPTP